jgi:hypothetical protein
MAQNRQIKEKTMANKKFWLGMLVIAFTMVVCDNGYTPTPPVYTPPSPTPPPPAIPGDSASNPIDRIADTNLGTMTSSASGWQQLLNSINSTGKYINLDLSACTMTGTSFNPDATVATGKEYIVSIILPTVATSIEAATYSSNSAFYNFSNLESISGANITTIGGYSFNDKYRLQSVDFPKVTAIGVNAFNGCRNLQSISFPASAELGYSSTDNSYSNPFVGCDKLTFTLSGSGNLSVIEDGKALVRDDTILLAYPSASGNITMDNITSLDGRVFSGCSQLTSISFSQVATIGSSAFASCSNLQDISFPQTTSIGSSAFYSCNNLQDVSFPQTTSIGSQAFYNCSRLQTTSFPLATTIDSSTFSYCSNLLSLNIPKVTNIGSMAFQYTEGTALTIIMGSTAPILGYRMFYDFDVYYNNSTTAKTVRVKVPAGATGYGPFPPTSGSSVTVSGTNTTANWANGFRGGGWNGYTWNSDYNYGGSSSINQNITVIIEQQ